MSTIVFIRHGITEGNQKKYYYGATDIPLVEEGIGALKKRKEAGIYPSPEGFSFITSELKRTEQTLFEIYGDVPHKKDFRLNEMNFGKFEMRSYETLKEDPQYIEWISGDNPSNVCPAGESLNAVYERAGAAFEEYRGGNYIIVCHGGIIFSLMQSLFPEKNMNIYEWLPEPCEGYAVTFDEEKNPVVYRKIKL